MPRKIDKLQYIRVKDYSTCKNNLKTRINILHLTIVHKRIK